MTQKIRASRAPSRWSITGRILLAAFGGYLLTSLIIVLLSYSFSVPISTAIFTANHFSFALYLVFILWIFAAGSLARVALYILVACIFCFLLILWLGAKS